MLKVIVIGWITWFQTQFCIEGVLIAYQSEWINESKIFTVNPKEAMRSFISWRFYSSMLGSLVYVALYKIHPVKLLRVG
uniref:Uncharacterized protein n=1 Tax=Acrobeloides nanus TaxID=290746 RepID=A0A914DBU1_9BILA